MLVRQKGASMWSWLVVMAMASIYIIVGLQLVPIYFENLSVKKALKNLEEIDREQRTKKQIVKALQKQFLIDSVNTVKTEHIKIKPIGSGKLSISIDYDARVTVAGNLYVVVEFRERVDI